MSAELNADFHKRFSSGKRIHGQLKLPAAAGGVTVLFGPSGCGKTTVLRALAGLERPEQGRIEFAGETWLDAAHGVFWLPQRRGVGFLFQHYALFPHLTVFDNVAFGLQERKFAAARERVGSLLDVLQISALADRYPGQLSGGQQQRVALARAICCQPRLLLLDEPLSALDALVRQQLRGELRKILLEFARPAIVVTHDRVEALALSDRVIVMIDGEVREQGPAEQVFSRPGNRAVAEIVGLETIEPGTVLSIAEGLATVGVGTTRLVALCPEGGGQRVFVCIRGEDVHLQKSTSAQASARNQLAARVESLIAEGAMMRVGLDCGFALTALVTRPACEDLHLQVGDSVVAYVKAPAVHLVPHDGAASRG